MAFKVNIPRKVTDIEKPIGKIVPQHKRPKLVFSKTFELAKAYANGQTEGSARQGRIFIDGATIYSYGKHFPIARRIAPDIYEFNTRRYSVTTSKQQGEVKRALSTKGYKIIEKELY